MRVKAPAEKNFRRSRVRPSSRKGGSGLLRWVSWRLGRYVIAMLVIAYAGYTATTLILHASALQVRRISVHGNVRISSGEVQAIVDGLRGTSIITADLPGYRRRLMESPWIADVALRRVLPSTVEIFVSERRPVGLCRLGSALYLIDPSGTLIDEFGPQYAEFDLPIIDPARAELAARVIEAVAPRKDIAQRVSQIDVRDAHDAIVMLQDDVALLHLGEDKFLERLQSYVDLAPALREQVSEIDYVDLRFGERVYVRPAAVKR
jgi:cell division protein FtsQ